MSILIDLSFVEGFVDTTRLGAIGFAAAGRKVVNINRMTGLMPRIQQGLTGSLGGGSNIRFKAIGRKVVNANRMTRTASETISDSGMGSFDEATTVARPKRPPLVRQDRCVELEVISSPRDIKITITPSTSTESDHHE